MHNQKAPFFGHLPLLFWGASFLSNSKQQNLKPTVEPESRRHLRAARRPERPSLDDLDGVREFGAAQLLAAEAGDLETIKYLATSSNINTLGWLGWSALHNAASKGQSEVVRYILTSGLGASVDIKDTSNHTPLLMASGQAETEGHIETVRILIANDADVDAVDDGDYSALHLAVANGNISTAKLLLEAGCTVDHQNCYRFTPLHAACQQKHKDLIQLLLKYGASLEIQDAHGRTPLQVAKEAGLNLKISPVSAPVAAPQTPQSPQIDTTASAKLLEDIEKELSS